MSRVWIPVEFITPNNKICMHVSGNGHRCKNMAFYRLAGVPVCSDHTLDVVQGIAYKSKENVCSAPITGAFCKLEAGHTGDHEWWYESRPGERSYSQRGRNNGEPPYEFKTDEEVTHGERAVGVSNIDLPPLKNAPT